MQICTLFSSLNDSLHSVRFYEFIMYCQNIRKIDRNHALLLNRRHCHGEIHTTFEKPLDRFGFIGKCDPIDSMPKLRLVSVISFAGFFGQKYL